MPAGGFREVNFPVPPGPWSATLERHRTVGARAARAGGAGRGRAGYASMASDEFGVCDGFGRIAVPHLAGDSGGGSETRRHADLYDPDGRAAEFRWTPREYLRDDPR